MRTFVCVYPDEAASAEIADFMGKLKKFNGFRWAEQASLHITLKFLGETAPELITKLDTNMSRIGGIRPFRVRLAGVGAFPGLASPKALWIGVGEGKDSLAKLAGSVDRAAAASGYETEKRGFHPHLTLARVRPGSVQGLTPELASLLASPPLSSWVCDSFTLMKSDLKPGGAIYTPIARFSL
jgi:2'-5' RNA ligase